MSSNGFGFTTCRFPHEFLHQSIDEGRVRVFNGRLSNQFYNFNKIIAHYCRSRCKRDFPLKAFNSVCNKSGTEWREPTPARDLPSNQSHQFRTDTIYLRKLRRCLPNGNLIQPPKLPTDNAAAATHSTIDIGSLVRHLNTDDLTKI